MADDVGESFSAERCLGPAAELIANAMATLFFECVVVSFGLEG